MEIPLLCNGNLKNKPFGKQFTIPTKFEHSLPNFHSLAIIYTVSIYWRQVDTVSITQQHGIEDRFKLETTATSIHSKTDKLWSTHFIYSKECYKPTRVPEQLLHRNKASNRAAQTHCVKRSYVVIVLNVKIMASPKEEGAIPGEGQRWGFWILGNTISERYMLVLIL